MRVGLRQGAPYKTSTVQSAEGLAKGKVKSISREAGPIKPFSVIPVNSVRDRDLAL